MRIGYVTTYDGWDVENWSGCGYYIAKALEQQSIEVVRVGPLKTVVDSVLRAKLFFHNHVTGKVYQLDRDPSVLRSYAEQVTKQLDDLDVDVVFSPGTIPISYLKYRKPIVFWTDATYAAMVGYYPGGWSNLSRQSVKNGNRMEGQALSNCRLAIYTSEWAATSAKRNYRVDPSKVKVVPFGPNFDATLTLTDIQAMVARRPADVCRLIFMGTDWYRKGGDIAVELAKRLNARGLKTDLVVVGSAPSHGLPEFVTVNGFLSKRTFEGHEVIKRLLSDSHFLVLPTRADCVPVVIAEANAYGVPVVASDVGGIPSAVTGGINGAAFPLRDFVEQACSFIQTSMADAATYSCLAEASFGRFESELNWQSAGKQVKKYLEEIQHSR